MTELIVSEAAAGSKPSSYSALLYQVQDQRSSSPLLFQVCLTSRSISLKLRSQVCDRDCQALDYKQGKGPTQLPHKASCGKTHIPSAENEALSIVDGALDSSKLKLYTTSPTTLLQTQIEFLAANPTAHYGFRRAKNGKYVAHQIQGKGGELFLQMRQEALEKREPASIALMEKMLAISTLPLGKDIYTHGDYVPQIEKEYEVDLEECHLALKASQRHQALFNAWLEWVKPRIRDDAPALGVRFGLPWYYFNPGGEFTHPIKYRATPTGLERRI